jgi:uncharacterized RDD family membrane protein YckC
MLVIEYAGLWRRLLADLIDSLVMIALSLLLYGIAAAFLPIVPQGNELISGLLILFEVLFLSVILSFFYNAILQSSPLQATLGMLVIKIKTVDYDGKRISLARACARELVYKLLWHTPLFTSGLAPPISFLIGFLLAMLPIGLTKRKQGLQDLSTRVLVIKRKI